MKDLPVADASGGFLRYIRFQSVRAGVPTRKYITAIIRYGLLERKDRITHTLACYRVGDHLSSSSACEKRITIIRITVSFYFYLPFLTFQLPSSVVWSNNYFIRRLSSRVKIYE